MAIVTAAKAAAPSPAVLHRSSIGCPCGRVCLPPSPMLSPRLTPCSYLPSCVCAGGAAGPKYASDRFRDVETLHRTLLASQAPVAGHDYIVWSVTTPHTTPPRAILGSSSVPHSVPPSVVRHVLLSLFFPPSWVLPPPVPLLPHPHRLPPSSLFPPSSSPPLLPLWLSPSSLFVHCISTHTHTSASSDSHRIRAFSLSLSVRVCVCLPVHACVWGTGLERSTRPWTCPSSSGARSSRPWWRTTNGPCCGSATSWPLLWTPSACVGVLSSTFAPIHPAQGIRSRHRDDTHTCTARTPSSNGY